MDKKAIPGVAIFKTIMFAKEVFEKSWMFKKAATLPKLTQRKRCTKILKIIPKLGSVTYYTYITAIFKNYKIQ